MMDRRDTLLPYHDKGASSVAETTQESILAGILTALRFLNRSTASFSETRCSMPGTSANSGNSAGSCDDPGRAILPTTVAIPLETSYAPLLYARPAISRRPSGAGHGYAWFEWEWLVRSPSLYIWTTPNAMILSVSEQAQKNLLQDESRRWHVKTGQAPSELLPFYAHTERRSPTLT